MKPKNGIRLVSERGSVYWSLNGLTHRTDGPAVEWANGYKAWYINGRRHRTDGPAVERPDGLKVWYLDGNRYGEGCIPPADFELCALLYEGLT